MNYKLEKQNIIDMVTKIMNKDSVNTFIKKIEINTQEFMTMTITFNAKTDREIYEILGKYEQSKEASND